MIWQNDFDAEDCGYDQNGIVSFWTCAHCGAEYEIFIPVASDDDDEGDA